MAITGDDFDLTDNFANAFKRVFRDDASQDLYVFDSPLLKRIRVTDGFVGTDEEVVRATSFMGGYGFGSMPRNNESNLIRPRLTAKKFYATAILDTESMAASMKSKGAFFDLVDRVKLEINRAMSNGFSLALTSANEDNELVLGIIAGTPTGSGTTGDPYVCTLDDGAGGNPLIRKFHVKQIVSVQDGNTDLFEVQDIDESAGTVDLVLLTGSQVPADNDEIMLQGADGNSMLGLPGATAASGTLYNVTIGSANNWLATRDTSGGAIEEHRLYNMLLDIAITSGEVPDLIVCGLTQFKKIAEMLANKRVLNDLSDAMGHRGLVLEGPEGAIPIIWDRHVENDRIYLLNTKHMELRKRPLSGIVEHGGSVLHPMYINGNDQYLIVYRCYGDFFIEPTYQGIFDGLSE
jgi:hypothetical protein